MTDVWNMKMSDAVSNAAAEDGLASPLKPNLTTASTITMSSSDTSSNDDEGTHEEVADDVHGYFTEAHVNQANKRADEENEKLNLNLGLPVDLTVFTRRDDTSATGLVQKALRPPIRILIRLLDRLLSFIESPFFEFWSNRVPLKLRQRLTFIAWGIYLPIHKALVGRRPGLHKDASLEYHALTSVMWWGRLVSSFVHA